MKTIDAKIIIGPTGIGKNDFSLKIAKKIQKKAAIINLDSTQTYKNIPIITNQPTGKISEKIINNKIFRIIENSGIDHFLYSYKEDYEKIDLFSFSEDLKDILKYLAENNITPIMTGGSMMYIRQVLSGIRKIPEISEKNKNISNNTEYSRKLDFILKKDSNFSNFIDKNNTQRITRCFEVLLETGKLIYRDFEDKKYYLEGCNLEKIALVCKKSYLSEKILTRFQKQLEIGAIKEVESVIKNNNYEKISNAVKFSIGFKEIHEYLEQKITLKEVVEFNYKRNMNYIKKQLTWIRNDFDDFEKIELSI